MTTHYDLCIIDRSLSLVSRISKIYLKSFLLTSVDADAVVRLSIRQFQFVDRRKFYENKNLLRRNSILIDLKFMKRSACVIFIHNVG